MEEEVMVAAEAAVDEDSDEKVEWSCPLKVDDIKDQIDFRLTLEMFNCVAAGKLLAFAMGLHSRFHSPIFALPRLLARSLVRAPLR